MMPREVKGFLPITRMSIDRKVATTGQGWEYEADQDVERRLTGGLRFGLKPHPPMADVANRRPDNAHCCAMRLQRRLSTAFAAAGHPVLRPNSLARLCQPITLSEMAAQVGKEQ